jgi:N-acetylmuramoyl-L-alanine amidase
VPDIIQHPSPNFDARGGEPVRYVILHYTGMKSGADALARLSDPAAKVSSHYFVEEDGHVFQLVDEGMRAWHAGKSYWRGTTDLNACSIGIEIVNPGHEWGYRAFPQAQMDAVRDLCLDIKQRHALPADAFIGHSDIAPARKEDPGELFDWKALAASGIGIWPVIEKDDAGDMEWLEAASLLGRIGYARIDERLGQGGEQPPEFAPTLKAFQRHFTPDSLTGSLNDKTNAALRAVARQVKR